MCMCHGKDTPKTAGIPEPSDARYIKPTAELIAIADATRSVAIELYKKYNPKIPGLDKAAPLVVDALIAQELVRRVQK